MNNKQYYAISIFFFVLLFYLPVIISYGINHESIYFGVRDGILSVIMYLAPLLMILFFVLAVLESKKRK